jgi:hypothetical protein
MLGRLKLLFAKLTILFSLLALGGTTYYYTQIHSFNKAFQLGVLAGAGTFAASALFFYILLLILRVVSSKKTAAPRKQVKEVEKKKERKVHVIPKEERIVHHSSKEAFAENNTLKKETVFETQQKLQELKGEQGSYEEVLLILPHELAFLLAKESIESLFMGKVIDEDRETGMLLGRAGFRAKQTLKLTVQPATERSSRIEILSKATSGRQLEKRNQAYIEKISDFLRKKEKLYLE